MKNLRLILISLVIVGFFAACQKNGIPVYSDIERINFDYNSMGVRTEDGVLKDTFNFDMGFSALSYDSINLEFILIGYAKNYEREIGLEITGDKEYVGSILDIPERIVLPADSVKVTVPCKIHITEDLQAADKLFHLRIVDSENLYAGNRTTVCLTASADVPTVWVGDENWWGNKIESFFGECSKAKYRFVYQVLGVWDFSNWNGTGFSSSMGDAGKFNPAKRLLKQALAEYEAENGPLVDEETGKQVTFPD